MGVELAILPDVLQPLAVIVLLGSASAALLLCLIDAVNSVSLRNLAAVPYVRNAQQPRHFDGQQCIPVHWLSKRPPGRNSHFRHLHEALLVSRR